MSAMDLDELDFKDPPIFVYADYEATVVTRQNGRLRDACRESRGTRDRDTHACVLRGWFRPCDPDRVRISWLCMAWLSTD